MIRHFTARHFAAGYFSALYGSGELAPDLPAGLHHFAARHFAGRHFQALSSTGEEEVPVPEVPGGGGGGGYFYRRGEEEEEAEERRRREREERYRDLARIIDRAIARAQGQLEPPEEAETPLPVAEVAAIDDALERIQDRVQAIDALGQRILKADAELEALRAQAIALIREAELDDDDEALELLLAG
jgi:hypothetical protein